MFKLYNNAYSTCSQKVRLVLAEKGIHWEDVQISFKDNEHFAPWYLKLNPNGVVPTLQHDDTVVVDSSVIMEYLDEVAPEPAAHLEHLRMGRAARAVAVAAHHRQVGTGQEAALAGGDHAAVYRRIAVDPIHQRVQRIHQLDREHVHRAAGHVDGREQDAVGAQRGNDRRSHVVSSRTS